MKNILVNSRVSDGFDVEAGRPFILCKNTCNIFVTYEWFNRIRHKDYRAVGVKLDLDLYRGINIKISYKKGLSMTPVTTDNQSIFMNITLNTDRLLGIPSQARDIVEGIDEKIFSRPVYRYDPLKIEGYAVRMRHQRR